MGPMTTTDLPAASDPTAAQLAAAIGRVTERLTSMGAALDKAKSEHRTAVHAALMAGAAHPATPAALTELASNVEALTTAKAEISERHRLRVQFEANAAGEKASIEAGKLREEFDRQVRLAFAFCVEAHRKYAEITGGPVDGSLIDRVMPGHVANSLRAEVNAQLQGLRSGLPETHAGCVGQSVDLPTNLNDRTLGIMAANLINQNF